MQSPLFIGVDVAKSEVVIACSESSFPVRGIPNELARVGAISAA